MGKPATRGCRESTHVSSAGPTAALRVVAETVFDAIGDLVPGAAPSLYGRVDLIEDDDGRLVVLELELTEPSLFLPQAPAAAMRFVTAVERVIG